MKTDESVADGKGRCDLLPLDIIAGYVSFDEEEDAVLSAISDYIRSGKRMFLKVALDEFRSLVKWDVYTMALEVSIHYADGAKKYSERNWEKGINLHCYIDSGVRHYLKWLRGDKDEPHDRAFVWNMLGALWTQKHKPDLIDLPFVQNDERKTECPDRRWFGDYGLHYCDRDTHICENPNECPFKEGE